ncbi:hypothetical protein PG994_010322 [Apiospora phragmitis]|uniref:Uncharacterized protein n=1 Tax=Apiospora phragmitis TaxID=2905665 RepID=A0ABR1TQ40_9PEZI
MSLDTSPVFISSCFFPPFPISVPLELGRPSLVAVLHARCPSRTEGLPSTSATPGVTLCNAATTISSSSHLNFGLDLILSSDSTSVLLALSRLDVRLEHRLTVQLRCDRLAGIVEHLPQRGVPLVAVGELDSAGQGSEVGALTLALLALGEVAEVLRQVFGDRCSFCGCDVFHGVDAEVVADKPDLDARKVRHVELPFVFTGPSCSPIVSN